MLCSLELLYMLKHFIKPQNNIFFYHTAIKQCRQILVDHPGPCDKLKPWNVAICIVQKNKMRRLQFEIRIRERRTHRLKEWNADHLMWKLVESVSDIWIEFWMRPVREGESEYYCCSISGKIQSANVLILPKASEQLDIFIIRLIKQCRQNISCPS